MRLPGGRAAVRLRRAATCSAGHEADQGRVTRGRCDSAALPHLPTGPKPSASGFGPERKTEGAAAELSPSLAEAMRSEFRLTTRRWVSAGAYPPRRPVRLRHAAPTGRNAVRAQVRGDSIRAGNWSTGSLRLPAPPAPRHRSRASPLARGGAGLLPKDRPAKILGPAELLPVFPLRRRRSVMASRNSGR